MLTQEYLKECLHYDPDTGVFTWKERPRSHFKSDRSMKRVNNMYAGKIAGSVDTPKNKHTSYIKISINGKPNKAHRLAFLYMENKIPEQVDHINKDGTNNKWSNIRPATTSQNCRNRKLRADNNSGENCVAFRKSCNRWVFQMHLSGQKPIHKYFKTKIDAVNYRDETYKKMKFSDTHGK